MPGGNILLGGNGGARRGIMGGKPGDPSTKRAAGHLDVSNFKSSLRRLLGAFICRCDLVF